MLCGRDLVWSVGDTTILHGVDLEVRAGRVLALIGPNGAGKSTLLRLLAGELWPRRGSVQMDGADLACLTGRELARRRAVLPQQSNLMFAFSALDIVMMGCHPNLSGGERPEDVRLALAIMDELGMVELAERDVRTLSGGEQQRVHLARVLCQLRRSGGDSTPYLLLDEPTNNLDIAHQHDVMRLARAEAERGAGVLAVLHDLNLAALHADDVAVIKQGRVMACGQPVDVLTERMVADCFATSVTVQPHPAHAGPLLVFNP